MQKVKKEHLTAMGKVVDIVFPSEPVTQAEEVEEQSSDQALLCGARQHKIDIYALYEASDNEEERAAIVELLKEADKSASRAMNFMFHIRTAEIIKNEQMQAM